MYASSRDYEMAMVPWPEETKQAFLADQFRLQTDYYDSYYPDAQFQIVELEGQAIGRLYVHETSDTVYVMDIALLAEHRGRGIGERLMRQVIGEAHGKGKRVTCHVEMNNRAQRLYHRLGFKLLGEHGVYYELELVPTR